jgi:hypothetical protein
MVKELHTWTLGDLRERGEQFLFPGGDVPDLIPRRMWKLVEANPDHPPDLPVAACLIVDGKRASSITLPNQTLRFRGESYPCLWGHLWTNLEGNPLPGAGFLLMQQLVRRLMELGVAFAGTGPTKIAAPILERLGVKQVSFCPRYVLAVGADALSRRMIGPGPMAKAGSVPLGVGVAAWANWARWRLAGDARAYRRRDLDSWNEDLRVLRNNPRAGYIHIGRSAEFVGWKENFSRWSAPKMVPRSFSLSRGGEPAGYVNMRYGVHERLGRMGFENARMLRVMDCVTDSPQATAAAVYHVIGIARETRCDFVEFVSSDAWLIRVARHANLKESNGMAVHLRCPEGWTRELQEGPARWNIGLMESDGAFAKAPVEDPEPVRTQLAVRRRSLAGP